MSQMNESTINTLFGIVQDPIKNACNTGDKKQLAEIERIIRIFNITKSQEDMLGDISARGLAAFKMLVSNN